MPTPTKRPARRVAARPRQDIEDESSNGDDEAPPRPSKRPTGTPKKSPIKRGWGEGQKQMDSTSSFAQTFKPDERSVIIKFLEDVPYANFRRHWIETTNQEGQKTNRPWTCPMSFGKACPLCDIGHKPQATSSFNIAICDENGSVDRKSWDVGARLFNVLKAYAADPKIAPLTKGFFLVSRTGKKGSTQYNISPVKASSLEEDYDIPVPAKADLDALDLYTEEIVEIPLMSKLQELAAELDDDYE
jgi:hypothetical protein